MFVEVQTSSMFLATSCPNQVDPDPSNLAGSSFCMDCASTVAAPPTSAPTSLPIVNETAQLMPIETREELLDAIDSYLADDSPTSNVSLVYGYPIGTWNVSVVTNFSSIFSAERNPLASLFDEALSGWDTTSAVSMENAFAGAALFNGDVSTWSMSKVTTTSGMCKWPYINALMQQVTATNLTVL